MKAKITKIEYKITTTIKGVCPHCKEVIDIENAEELSDDVPPQEYFDRRTAALKQGIDEYLKFMGNNPIYNNFNNLIQTWKERVEALQIKSLIKSESIYVYNGDCPYCNKNVDLKLALFTIHNAPPRFKDNSNDEKTLIEWLNILKEDSPDPSKDAHFMEDCPRCGQIIHLTNEMFYKGSDCPIHVIDLKNAKQITET
ncbi:MAG: hypothetical protein PHZ02_01400 [Desulfocapsaceae bacterium]|nr:hypothetical protein [Desulfocapsaceae bacterium]